MGSIRLAIAAALQCVGLYSSHRNSQSGATVVLRTSVDAVSKRQKYRDHRVRAHVSKPRVQTSRSSSAVGPRYAICTSGFLMTSCFDSVGHDDTSHHGALRRACLILIHRFPLSSITTLSQSPLPSRPQSWLPSTNPPYFTLA